MNDGRIVAADLQYYANAGNTLDESVLVGRSLCRVYKKRLQSLIFFFFLQVVEKILLHMDNAYNIPNLQGRAAACRTNLPSNTAFRGFGVPQSIMVVENMVNDIAVVLGRPADEVHNPSFLYVRLMLSAAAQCDRLPFSFLRQIREINMYKGPSATHYKFEFSPENMLRCWEECKVKSDYSARRRDIDQFNQQNRWKKRGMSIIPIKYGIAFGEGFLNQVCGIHVGLSWLVDQVIVAVCQSDMTTLK